MFCNKSWQFPKAVENCPHGQITECLSMTRREVKQLKAMPSYDTIMLSLYKKEAGHELERENKC